jgi:hypothetical protein
VFVLCVRARGRGGVNVFADVGSKHGRKTRIKKETARTLREILDDRTRKKRKEQKELKETKVGKAGRQPTCIMNTSTGRTVYVPFAPAEPAFRTALAGVCRG